MILRPARELASALLLAALACGPPAAKVIHRTAVPQAEGANRRAGAARPLDSLVADGERIYMRGQFDSARAVWRGALARSRVERDSVAEARTLTWLGLAAWRLGEYAEARGIGEQALELKRRWALDGELSKSYNALGLLAWNQGRLGEATDLFGKALAAAQAAADPKAAASASGNLALVQTELGDFEAARQGFDSMRVAAHALGDARIEGNAHTNLGMLFVRIGEPQSAVPELEAARRLYRTAGYSTGEENALAQLGTAYTALGIPHLALAMLDSALALSRAQGLRQEEAGNLEALAGLYRAAGDLWRALALLAKAGDINRALDLAVEAASDARQQAEIQASLGSIESARKLGQAALEGHRASRARYEEVSDLLLLADLADASDLAPAADARLHDAHAVAARLGEPLSRADVALAEGRIADRRGQSDRVLQVLRVSRGDVAAGGYEAEEESLRLESRALARLGHLDSAVAAARRAVEAVERIRGQYASAYLQTTYLADHQAAYGELASMLLHQGHPGQAFEAADAARGHAFLAYASGVDDRRSQRPDPGLEQVLGRAAALSHELEAAEHDLAEGDTAAGTRAKRLDQMLKSARDDYEDLLVRRSETGNGDASRAAGGRTRVADVQRSLTSDEGLIEYDPLADSMLVFVVRHDTVAGFRFPVSASRLLGHVRFARALTAQPEIPPDRPDQALEWLYRELVGRIQASNLLTGVRDLLIVPQGVLTYLPFAALKDPDTHRYLVQDYGLRTLPSAALQVALSADSTAPSRRVGAAAVMAPLPDELPRSVAEARAVARSLPDAVTYIGRQAGEPAVRAALASGAIVHLATHALMNARNPMFSSILLSRAGATEPDADGSLEVHEILRLRLHTPLVFLSGCETGLGASWSSDFARGDDYATLAQAFLDAGARNVIATLWPVEDEGAAEFADRFYRELASRPADQALAVAQRQMMMNQRYGAPYYWAGYVLSGDGRIRGASARRGAVAVR